MTASHPTGRRTNALVGVAEVDAALLRAVRRATRMRQCFYLVVLTVALAGQVTGAVVKLHIPLLWAVPAFAALELGGVVVFANADVRRRLGERAIASRVLSALIAVWAVAFNWLAHDNHLMGGFFAGMSALGYLVWVTHAENQRRDRLRATGDLPPTTPAYEFVHHWLRHPWVTLRARSLAKSDPDLDLYGSLAAARDQINRERRQHAIATVLHRKIRAAVDPDTADIAVAVYDLDQIAARLAAQADYDALTDLISADLTPQRLATAGEQPSKQPEPGAESADPRSALRTHLHDVIHSNPPAGHVPDPVAPVASSTERIEPEPVNVPAGVAPVAPAGAQPVPSSASTQNLAEAVYAPASEEDAAMYTAWRRGVANGQEPTGADLARAAGRADDATGIGRRAARRYREAHKPLPCNGKHTNGQGTPAAVFASVDTTAIQRQHNGHNPSTRSTGAPT